MAADQPNRKYFKYVDDDGVEWAKMGQIDAACNAIDGNADFTPGQTVWPKNTPRNHVRRAVFQDPDTLRTKSCEIYTGAAYDAITTATTVAVHVQGETATITYNFADKIPERKQRGKASRNDPDHA